MDTTNFVLDVKGALIKDSRMVIYDYNPETIERIITEMKKLNIRRIICMCYDDISLLSNSVRKLKEVRIYQKTDTSFKETAIGDVYQLYNPDGEIFINGPFQKCAICKNWFMYNKEELKFLESKGIKGTITCKRCKGRRVISA